MLNESEIQKPTKFHAPHCRRSGSTVIMLNIARGFSPTQLLLTRLQIKVVQHQLSIGQAWLG